jgi:choline dehydrogenase-like flavoprotein
VLRSADPTAKPRIRTNSLSVPEDVASLLAGVRLARRIAEQPVLAEIITEELKPGARAPTPISRTTCAAGSCSSTTPSARAA